MAPDSDGETTEQPAVIPQFYQRFSIEVGSEAAERRFINRVINMIYSVLPGLETLCTDSNKPRVIRMALINVATGLGVTYVWNRLFSEYASRDLYSCLIALESLYRTYIDAGDSSHADKIDTAIRYTISISEVDLGLRWRNGVFWPAGAKILDRDLVDEDLKWLADLGLQQVANPFEKGLRHFLEARKQPEKLADTITDIYEAMEAMAKLTCSNDKDLSANKEQFISKVNLSPYYKKMLGDYIEYANQYRHGVKPGEKRELPKYNEVEAFLYITGLFIRLAVQQATST